MADKSLVLVRPHIPKASTRLELPTEAIADIRDQLDTTRLAGVMLCCAASYDFEALGPAIAAAFNCPVLAVSSAGELHFGHDRNSIIGVGFPAALFEVRAMHAWPVGQTAAAAAALKAHNQGRLDQANHVGLLYFDDGAPQCDALQSLAPTFQHLQFIGAAAGRVDGRGLVYHNGVFHQGYAAGMVLESQVQFTPFSMELAEQNQATVDYQLLVETLKSQMPDMLFTLGFENLQHRTRPATAGCTIDEALNALNLSGMGTTGQLIGDTLSTTGFAGVVFGV